MPSPAQLLPALILENIVEYTVGEYKWKNIRDSIEGEKMFRFTVPLIEVCSTWREAALDRIYRDVWWCSNTIHTYGHLYRRQYLSVHKSLHHALETDNISRVKSVRLHFSCLTVLDGSPFDLFEAAPFRSLELSGVRIIDFRFEVDPDVVHDIALFESTPTAQAFCDKINRMFPNAKARTISRFDLFGKHASSPFISTLTSGIFANTATIDTCIEYGGASTRFPDSMVNMRSISIGYGNIESETAELIRRNAETLGHLTVMGNTPTIFSRVIIADDGVPIVYPHLISLNFSLRYQAVSFSYTRLDSPAGTPFPSLEKLVCKCIYPFANDILFRGNAHTLEYLDIDLRPMAVQTLKSHRVFTAERLPKLKYANGYIFSDTTESNPCVDVDFFFQLAANANVLRTDGTSVSFGSLDMEIENFGQNITVLELVNVKFTLRELLELVSRLPHLNRLGTDIIETDELRSTDRSHDDCRGLCRNTWNETSNADGNGDGSNNDSYDSHYQYYFGSYVHTRDFFFAHQDTVYADMDFVDELYQQYYPLSKTLVFLDASEYPSNPMASCKMVALLCVLCPTIRCVKANSHDDNSYLFPVPMEECYIERHDIEETGQYISLVSRLQFSSLSIY